MALEVCFLGIDGSGKTSCASGLHKKLESLGVNSRYIHHTFSLLDHVLPLLKNNIRSYASNLSKNNTSFTDESADISLKTRIISTLFCFFAVINSFVSRVVELKPFFKGVIIYDRHSYDHIVPYIDFIPSFFSRFFVKLIKQPDIIFFLDIASEIALKRKKADTLDFYIYQAKLITNFINKANLKNIIRVDTKQDIAKVNSLVFEHVNNLLKLNDK